MLVFIAALNLHLPKPPGSPQSAGSTSLTMQQLSPEKISFFVAAGAMPARGKNSSLYGCSLDTAKSVVLLLLQWPQLSNRQSQIVK